jgi:hypothetical protein
MAGNFYQVLGDVICRLERAGATKRTRRALHDDCGRADFGIFILANFSTKAIRITGDRRSFSHEF